MYVTGLLVLLEGTKSEKQMHKILHEEQKKMQSLG
jgi:hypothetical protein